MKRLFIALIALFLSCAVNTQAQLTQQSIFPNLTGNELLDSLAIHFGPTTVLNYDNARNLMFSYIDNVAGQHVCIYTGDTISLSPNASDPKGEMNVNGWNTEHIWPQSKGAGEGIARSDIHHLRPIRADVNTSRSNKPFGYLQPANVNRWWKDNISQTTTPLNNLTEWSRSGSALFQVRDAQKGFTARAMFYFFTFYYTEAMETDSDYFFIQMQALRQYHNESMINQYEIDRTLRVQETQGNFNPFIMDTTLVRRAFFEDFDPNQAFGNTGYFVDFETGTKNTNGYTPGIITLNNIQWSFSNAYLVGDSGDEFIGSRSVRLRHETGATDPETFIRMDQDKTNGLGTVSFLYSRSGFSGDRTGTSPTFVVEYSTNQGDTWQSAGSPVSLAGVNSLQPASFAINSELPGRVRIRTISGDNNKRFNIDNFRITDFSTVVRASIADIAVLETTENSITVASNVLNQGGGTVNTRGFIYALLSENNDPIIGDDFVTLIQAGTGSGDFSTTISGLIPNTDYVIKAFATNQSGTSYSEEVVVNTGVEEVIDPDLAFQEQFNATQSALYTANGQISDSSWFVERSGNDWGARIFNNQLELTNTASANTNVNGWVFAYTPTSDFSKGYHPVLANHFGVISWSFNMSQVRDNPAGFGTGSYGAAYVLGTNDTNLSNSGVGYAIVLGNASSPDPIRLVAFTNGIAGTLQEIVVSPAESALEDPKNNSMSITVTFNPTTGLWQLFGRVDGASFSDPLSGELELIGQAVNTTHTSETLSYMGAYWQGSTAANQTAFFDNITVDIEALSLPFTTTLTGHEGWRILGSPLSHSDFTTFLSPFWTQGFPGANTTSGTPNVFIYDWEGSLGEGYYPPLSASQTLAPAQGILMYLFQNDDLATGTFPKNWELTGFASMRDIDVEINPSANGFTLVSNPYPVTLDWGQVLASNEDIKPVIYMYDHAYNGVITDGDIILSSGAYRTWNGSSGSLGSYLIAPFQGFWIQSDVANGSLTIPSSARVFGTPAQLFEVPLSFNITAESESNHKAEIWISFGDEGSETQNKFDALALEPLEYAPYVQFFILGEKALNSKYLPIEIQQEIILPLSATPLTPTGDTEFSVSGGNVSFSWEIPSTLQHLDFILIDNKTGAEIDMKQSQSYSWQSESSDKSTFSYSFGSLAKMDSESRFSVLIRPLSTEIDQLEKPTEVVLFQNYPNPFNPTTQIRFSMPESGFVSLNVYTVTGQRVTTLADGFFTQGNHQITFNAGNLASGVYLYRIQTGNQTITKKLMLLK